MNETIAPDDENVPTDMAPAPPPPAQPAEAAQTPAGAVKPKTEILYLILGLLTPAVLAAALVWTASLTGTASENSVVLAAPAILSGILFFLFVAFIFMWLGGRRTGNTKLRSYAKGGLWAYAAIPLAILVAFGSCLVGGLP